MVAKSVGLTGLIEDYQSGGKAAEEKLYEVVYSELKCLARSQMRRQKARHTLSPTALVHEVFMMLSGRKDLEIKNRRHFFAIAARSMRWVLRDYARAKKRQKRGCAPLQVSFREKMHKTEWNTDELVALNDLLTKLGAKKERLSRVVELKLLVGLSIEETAQVLEISPATVKRDWDVARAWLRRELSKI